MTCRIMEGVEMDHMARAFLFQGFPEMRGFFRERVQYICEPFMKAYEQAGSKVFNAFAGESVERQGTFIVRFDESGLGTIFYRLSARSLDAETYEIFCTIFIFYHHPDYELPLMVGVIHRPVKGDEITFMDHHLGGGEMTPDCMVHHVLSLVLFMKYCQLETKIVAPGKRAHHVGKKYVNESAEAVEILDSTWFTTIVRSEGFMVGAATGGFFRLQPCGPGLTEKKLIWIEPYEKKGYTKRAKMLRDGGNGPTPN